MPLLPKADIRKAALARRSAQSVAMRRAASLSVARRGLDLARSFGAMRAALYMPMRDEIDCLPLLAGLSEAGVATALPAMVAKDAPLVFRLWRPGEPLEAASFGVREPAPAAPELTPDLIFAPLAAFDRAGRRIGYGGGFYDRTLMALRAAGAPPVYVGLAFAAQEEREIPAEAHDARLDFVLTEVETISCAGA